MNPIVDDITADVGASTMVTISYTVEDYTNSCRPDATSCTGCLFGTSCSYDGGLHTEPLFSICSLIIAYR